MYIFLSQSLVLPSDRTSPAQFVLRTLLARSDCDSWIILWDLGTDNLSQVLWLRFVLFGCKTRDGLHVNIPHIVHIDITCNHLPKSILNSRHGNCSILSGFSSLRVPGQNGVSLLYIILEIHHSGWEPSIFFCHWCSDTQTKKSSLKVGIL